MASLSDVCPLSSMTFARVLSESFETTESWSVGVSAAFSALSSLPAAHTYGQQHRASTNRAHSRRHVIIVSVVVQWCGADLRSEGNGEQQGDERCGRHTHEERAAARHAPYAAHHARHTLQSTAAGTHRSPAATPTHRWRREKQTGAAHKAPPHAHTA
ncbi:mucin-associated surface protein (MASP), partial [Trypanosoma cruzi]